MSATLNDIRLKVRRITKSPSVNQLTDPQIDQYVNTFYIYDFPEHLRLFDLRTNLTITTQANIDTYDLPTSAPTSLGPATLGSVSTVTTVTFNIFTTLGLPSNATITPGSVIVTLNDTAGSAFKELYNTGYDGELIGTQGNAEDGQVVYNTGEIILNFNAPTTATAVSIAFTYSVPQFLTIHPPLYIAGFESYYTQSQSEFYRIYPKIRTIAALAYGDGVTTSFPGIFVNTPVLANNVLIDSVDVNGNALILNDNGSGSLFGTGTGTVNYVTGAVTANFTTAPAAGQAINGQTVPYVPSRPCAALYFADQLILRPVPDQSYNVEIEAYMIPTQLLAVNQQPQLAEWWQLLALGASLKVFEDRGDLVSYANYIPIFKQYMHLCERKTIVQQTNDRTQTIYTEMTQYGFGNFIAPF